MRKYDAATQDDANAQLQRERNGAVAFAEKARAELMKVNELNAQLQAKADARPLLTHSFHSKDRHNDYRPTQQLQPPPMFAAPQFAPPFDPGLAADVFKVAVPGA